MAPDQENEEIQNLQFLGLTLNQARVYSALAKLESATAKNLSGISGLAACDIYRVIPELQKLGLLETTIAIPKLFRATPPQDAMKILLKQKQEDIQKMQSKAKEFLAKIETVKNPENEDFAKIVLIPNWKRAVQLGMTRLLKTKEQLDAILKNELFYHLNSKTAKHLEKLLRRKVRMRFLLESTKAIERQDKDIAKLLRNPNFQVRIVKTKISASVLLHDNANAFVSTSMDGLNKPIYWTDNQCMVSVIRGYFENEWREASETQT